jgi:predicted MPP superfamily phosphohydrolase
MSSDAQAQGSMTEHAADQPKHDGSKPKHGRSLRGIVIALGIFVTLLALVHRYFYVRLVLDPELTGVAKGAATAFLAVAGSLIIAHPLLDRRFGPSVGQVLGWPAHFWLATIFYLLLVLGLSDLALLIFGLDGLPVMRQRAQIVVGVVGAVMAFGAYSGMRLPSVKRVEVTLPDWPKALDGFRIAQLSDVHIGTLIGKRFAARVTERVNALTPDAIAITGDLVDGSIEHIGDRVEPFAQLRARHGTYFVTGNHDYYSGAVDWCARVRELGIRVLRNERVAIDHDGTQLWIAGVDDYMLRRRSRADLDAALGGLRETDPVVLLAHNPLTFEDAHQRGVSLQLSGHTHGGQMWPFTWLVRLQTRFVAGLYKLGRSQLYVSLGTGYWGPPIRVLAPAEITLLTLRSAG